MKLPIASYQIPLIPGKPLECTPIIAFGPKDKTEEEWLACSSIRIDESCDKKAHEKVPSTVWFSSVSNKQMSDLRYLPTAQEMLPAMPDYGFGGAKNPYDACAENISGWWQTGEGVVYLIKRPDLDTAEIYPSTYYRVDSFIIESIHGR